MRIIHQITDWKDITEKNNIILKKVDELRRRSRGYTIKFSLGDLSNPAILNVPHNGERPVIWIDGNQVQRTEDVLKYWERATSFLKGKKQFNISDLQWYETEEAKVYIL